MGDDAAKAAADAAAAEAAKAADSAPETYDLKPMDGQEFNPAFIEKYQNTARKLNLSNEKAQTIIDEMAPVLQEQQIAELNKIREGWAESARTDKEFGGDKLEENLGVAKAALDAYGTQELKDLLNKSGLGNHPEIIRFFVKAGKSVKPDTFVGGNKGEGKTTPKTFNEQAEVLYGK